MMEASWKRLIAPGLVDSRLKLHLLLLFYRHPRLCAGAWSLNKWLHESPWAVEAALEALADSGLLARVEHGGHRQYYLAPSLEYQALLERLVLRYDDPQQRDTIYALVRLAEQEQQFQACLAADAHAIGEHGPPVAWGAVG